MPTHEELAELVAATELSRAEFARRLGASPPQLSNWLNGRVPIPEHWQYRIRALAASLAETDVIAPAMEIGGNDGTSGGVAWRFVRANPNAGKDFGNSGIYATPQSIPSLVRETGQNSLDAGGENPVTMRFTLFELSAGSNRRTAFLEAIRFNDSLAKHVLAASASGGSLKIGTRLASGLRDVEEGTTLRLLRIDDFGGKGLRGAEHDSTEPFSALVRDNLNSRKAQGDAGGVFGIGSKTLWACSRIFTVLFASKIEGEEDRGIRVIGKADLAWHERGRSSFAGAGWFGAPTADDGAESLWLPEDDPLLRALLLDRSPPDHESRTIGTTALIISFHDPKSDDDDGRQIVEKFARAAAENFWPAMIRDQLAVHVAHVMDDGGPTSELAVNVDDHVPALADAYRKHLAGEVTERLERPGDTVSVPIQFDVPATRPGGGVEPAHSALSAECRLVIRLADPVISDRWVDHVGSARGRAMIVKYDKRSGITTGARPFHAFLAAGVLAGSGPHERAAEQFLRFAEPTSHDDWSLNGDLKERYAHGAGARLRELSERVVKALQQYVKTETTTSSEGPAVLKELFSLRVPVRPPARGKWRLRNVQAKPTGEGWHIAAEVALDRVQGPIKLTPKLSFQPESGRGVVLRWVELHSTDAQVADGALEGPEGTRRIRFSGIAVSDELELEPERCALRLDASVTSGGAE